MQAKTSFLHLDRMLDRNIVQHEAVAIYFAAPDADRLPSAADEARVDFNPVELADHIRIKSILVGAAGRHTVRIQRRVQCNRLKTGRAERQRRVAEPNAPTAQALQLCHARLVGPDHQLGAMIKQQLVNAGDRALDRIDTYIRVAGNPWQQFFEFQRQLIAMVARNAAAANIEMNVGDGRFGCFQRRAAFAQPADDAPPSSGVIAGVGTAGCWAAQSSSSCPHLSAVTASMSKMVKRLRSRMRMRNV